MNDAPESSPPDNAGQPTVFERIEQLLQGRGLKYSVLRHAPVFTSQEAAAIRGTSLSSGAKALVCKADQRMLLFVVPADRKLASAQVRKEQQIKSLRFASAEEVLELTGLKPGSIPPFGSLFGLPTWCDRRLAEAGNINFNAGDHGISVSLSFDDYLLAEQPTLGLFAE